MLGDGAPLPAVAALAELPEADTAAALAALARAEIVKDEQPLAFVHPLVRDAVYRDLPAAERELRHERAAARAAGAGASDEQVAAHLLLAPAARRRRPRSTLLRRGGADRRRPRRLRQRRHLPAPRARRAAGRHARGGDVLLELGHAGVAARRRQPSTEHLLQAYELHDDPRHPRRPRRRDRPHRGVRQPAGRRDGVRPGGARPRCPPS